MSITTVTINPTVDISTSVDRLVPDEKLRCSQPRYEPGGGGINVSRAITRLGGESLAVYTSGGVNGGKLRELLDEEGLDHDPVAIDGRTRETFQVMNNSHEQQYRFVMPGPELESGELEALLDKVFEHGDPPEYVAASGSLPPGAPDDFYARLAARARKENARMIIDSAGAPLRRAAREGVWLIKCNQREFRGLVDEELESEEDEERSACALVENGAAEVLVVSYGAGGAMVAASGLCERLRSPNVEARSKVGAGDSMVGGLTLGLARGKNILDSALLGIAAGAAAAMTPGTELCRGDDTRELYERLKREREK